jgi:hypothetical protein
MLATSHRPPARRGAILIVVLAMLALFAVIGLSFVLYAEAQATAARNHTRAYNDLDYPNAAQAAELAAGQMIFGTYDLSSGFRGHSLVESRFGFDYDTNPLTSQANSLFTPYPGGGIPAEPLAIAGQAVAPVNWNFSIDRRQVVNFTRINTDPSPTPTQWFVIDPQRQSGGVVRNQLWAPANANSPTVPGTFANKAAPYTYPDRSNFYLAMMDPTTGQVVVKSFHRDDLFLNTNPVFNGQPNEAELRAQFSLVPPTDTAGNPLPTGNPQWLTPDGRLKLIRPRPVDHTYNRFTKLRVAPGTAGSRTDFPYPVANADGSYTGDVSNLKYITGSQKNDSVWVYAGAPVFTWRGKKYTSLVAPLVLDLSGRVNLSVAGNVRQTGNGTAYQGKHTSNQGWGVWEINPRVLFSNTGTADPELLAVLRKRFQTNGPGASPQQDPYYASPLGRLGHSPLLGGALTTLLPPHYSRIDPDGVSTTAMGTGDPIDVSTTATQNKSFPNYPPRYPNSQAILVGSGLVNHPTLFNPTMYMRGTGAPTQTHPFGLDDLLRMSAQYTDSKARYKNAVPPTEAPTNMGANNADPIDAARARALTTLYSFTQQAAEVPIATSPNTAVRLGPIDVNRQLPDFRQNPQNPHSPTNNWDPSTLPYNLARQARQTLARDIFLRLAALSGFVDGTNVVYNPNTGYLNPINTATAPAATVTGLRVLAQYAANAVDFIDPDDISTPFVWNPVNPNFPIATTPVPSADPSADPTNYGANVGQHAVFGTELPKLVINEAYAALFNHREDPVNGGLPMNQATRDLRRQFWIELHNPLAPGGTADPALAENGAARLRYQSGVTPGYGGPTFNPYRLHAFTHAAAGQTNVLSNYLGTAAGQANVTGDPLPAGFDVNRFIRVDNYDNHTPTGTDTVNLVTPANGGPGVSAGNTGFYVIGPRDDGETMPNNVDFPGTGTFAPTTKLNDPPAGPGAHNSMSIDVTGNTNAIISAEVQKANTAVLQRLADPYRPESPTNPYITVDYLENIPTRDRVVRSSSGDHTNTTANANREVNGPSVGRRHPYAHGPSFTDTPSPPATQMVVDQGAPGAGTSPAPINHTMFNQGSPVNLNSQNVGRGPLGFEWLVHLDRQLVNTQELLHVSARPPHSLTHSFTDGTPFGYHRHTTYPLNATATAPMLRDPSLPLYRALDLIQAGNFMVGVPVGGREPGKMNVNGMQTEVLLRSVLDPQEGNAFFADNNVIQNGAGTPVGRSVLPVWNRIVGGSPSARSVHPAGIPRATADETGTPNTDRPFKGLSGGAFDDTLYRSQTGTPGGQSIFHHTSPGTLLTYTQNEPLRKGWNSLTTVSDSFLVLMTVGFFEVINDGPYTEANQPILGKELYELIPGDFRTQFGAVVDRSNVMRPAPITGMSQLGNVQRNTRLTRDAHVGGTQITVEALPGTPESPGLAGHFTLYDNGVPLRFGPTPNPNPLVLPYPTVQLGYGSIGAAGVPGDGETVKVGAAAQAVSQTPAATPLPGQVTLTLVDAVSNNPYFLQRPHGAGTRVANGLVGHPGPQPGFNLTGPSYQSLYNGVVPFFTKIER